MKRRHFAIGLGWGAVAALSSSEAPAFAEPKLDPLIADLVGEWRVTYTNEAVRDYRIDASGILYFDAEKSQSRIVKKSEAILAGFSGSTKMERLTMGVDGRLFVEHFPSLAELMKNKPVLIGIGIRQK